MLRKLARDSCKNIFRPSTFSAEAKFLDGLGGWGIDSWNRVGTKYGIYDKYFPAHIL